MQNGMIFKGSAIVPSVKPFVAIKAQPKAESAIDRLKRLSQMESAVKLEGDDFASRCAANSREHAHHKMRDALGNFYSRAELELKRINGTLGKIPVRAEQGI